MGFPSATYVNGLPRYRHNRREILPESPIANATKLVLAALEYRASIVAVSVGPLAVVTIFTYLERFLILDIFEQSSDRDGVFLKSCQSRAHLYSLSLICIKKRLCKSSIQCLAPGQFSNVIEYIEKIVRISGLGYSFLNWVFPVK